MTSSAEAAASERGAGPSGSDPVRETALITLFELKAVLLGMRPLLLFVIYGGAALAVGLAWVRLPEDIKNAFLQAGTHAKDALEQGKTNADMQQKLDSVPGWLGGPALIKAVASGNYPVPMLMVLFFTSFLLPGLVHVVGYDRISEEVHTKHARFVLQRVRRGSYVLGKLLGHFTVTMGVVVVVHLALTITGIAIDQLDQEQALRALPRVWAAMALFLLAYCAFTQMISANVVPPFAALALGGVGLMAMWFFSLIPALPVRAVWIGTWDMRLWLLEPEAIAVYLGHAVVFTGLAYAGLRFRDV